MASPSDETWPELSFEDRIGSATFNVFNSKFLQARVHRYTKVRNHTEHQC